MAKISWKTGDAFQVIASKPEMSKIDVEVYGVFTKSGNVCITKLGHNPDSPERNKVLPARENFERSWVKVISTRENFEGSWVVVHNSATAKVGYPGAVPIDSKEQWMPDEVRLVLIALEMAEKIQKE